MYQIEMVISFKLERFWIFISLHCLKYPATYCYRVKVFGNHYSLALSHRRLFLNEKRTNDYMAQELFVFWGGGNKTVWMLSCGNTDINSPRIFHFVLYLSWMDVNSIEFSEWTLYIKLKSVEFLAILCNSQLGSIYYDTEKYFSMLEIFY